MHHRAEGGGRRGGGGQVRHSLGRLRLPGRGAHVAQAELTLLLLILVVTNFDILKVYKDKAYRAEKDLEIRKKNDLEKIDVETAEF